MSAHANLAAVSPGRARAVRRPAASRPALPETLFHPAVAGWFADSFAAPTPAQAEAWPLIKAGRHTLIAAPTGSGKTLAAFLAAIDDLVRQGLEGRLADATQVVYVSPLKALSNDIIATSRRRSPASATICGASSFPMLKSAPGSGPATRRQLNAIGCGDARRTSW